MISIAAILWCGCKDEVFLTLFADPPTIAPNETSSLTAVIQSGNSAASAKPMPDATVQIWIPQTETAFAQLSQTTVTTNEQGIAVVKLKALATSPNKTIHVSAKAQEKTCNCPVIIKARTSEATEKDTSE
jgi:hypothetical protein